MPEINSNYTELNPKMTMQNWYAYVVIKLINF